MGLQQVNFQPKVVTDPGSSGHEGLGKWGQIAGLAAGTALAVGTAGIAAPAAIGLMAGGAGLGGTVGGIVDPAKADQAAMQRQAQAGQTQLLHSEQSQQLRDSLMALHEAPPEITNQYGPQLMQAYVQSLHNDNIGSNA